MSKYKELKELAIHAASGTAPTEFSQSDVNTAFAKEIGELCKTYRDYQRNKNDIYQIVEETADLIVPKRVQGIMGTFADVRQVGNGVKEVFKTKVGHNRGKKFLTQVGLSGVYEAFRLDTTSFELKAKAFGGAAYLDFERMLSGDETLADYMAVIVEGLEDAVFGEVMKALKAAFNSSDRPAANKVTVSAFDGDEMQKLCNTVKKYGTGVTIFATEDFIAAMGIDNFGTTTAPGYSTTDIEEMRNRGRVGKFRGVDIVEIPNSFTDTTNTTEVIDSQYAFVLPTGGEKVVKVLFEGETQIRDFENRDNSMEIQAWKKFGVGILCQYNWGIYQNTELA